MLQLLRILLALLVIGCAAGQQGPPSSIKPDTGSAASIPSMDERARTFFNTIAEGQTTIDQGTFLNYYRRQVAELARSGRVKMGKDKIAKSGTQLFRKLDRNHDSKITEEELKFALEARARERKKLQHINPREWNLLDDAF
ncbi:MAG: EF-hand domain-containing protein [Candidatus Poribacteria bacterium]